MTSNRCVLPSLSEKCGVVSLTYEAAQVFYYLLEKEDHHVKMRIEELRVLKLDNPRNTLIDVGLKTNQLQHDKILVYLEELNSYVTS